MKTLPYRALYAPLSVAFILMIGIASALSKSVAQLEYALDALSVEVRTLGARVEAASSNASSAVNAVNAVSGNVTGLATVQNVLSANMTTLKSEVTAVSSNASEALRAVRGLRGNVWAAMSAQNDKFAILEARIKALKVEGVMVTVKGGTLPLSSELGNQSVDSFQIGNYEVTWGEWNEVRHWAVSNNKGYDLEGVGGTYPEGRMDVFPVVNVSWYDALKWCNAKSEKEGKAPVYKVNGETYKTGTVSPMVNAKANGYRLPSEKEWEWAARGGVNGVSHNYVYSGSNDSNAVAWTLANSSSGTKVVGAKMSNDLGIYEMSGNVWEWCEDVENTSTSPIRGGSCNVKADNASVTYRGRSISHQRYFDVGFRVACSLEN